MSARCVSQSLPLNRVASINYPRKSKVYVIPSSWKNILKCCAVKLQAYADLQVCAPWDKTLLSPKILILHATKEADSVGWRHNILVFT